MSLYVGVYDIYVGGEVVRKCLQAIHNVSCLSLFKEIPLPPDLACRSMDGIYMSTFMRFYNIFAFSEIMESLTVCFLDRSNEEEEIEAENTPEGQFSSEELVLMIVCNLSCM